MKKYLRMNMKKYLRMNMKTYLRIENMKDNSCDTQGVLQSCCSPWKP